MIRREIKGGWVLFNQDDHAKLAGDIMRFWGNQNFSSIKPQKEVLFAIANHDSGWEEWDTNPRINPKTKYPMNFMEMYENEQHEIWIRCFEKYSKEHKYASALTALHFSKFNNKSLSKDPSNGSSVKLKQRINNFVSDMLNSKNEDKDKILIDLKFVQIGDIISLTLCHGWNSTELTDVPSNYNEKKLNIALNSDDGFNYKVSPYPFSESNLSFSLRGRRLLSKKYKSEEELRNNLAKAPYEIFYFTIKE